MKNLVIKIIVSVVFIIAVFFTIKLFANENLSLTAGTIQVTIVDDQGIIVFDDELEFYKGDSFFDVLNRNFDLTCANGSYQADEDCTYEFQSFGFQGKVLLGIKNDDFEVMSNWTNTFLSIEKYDGTAYKLTTVGVSNISFDNHDRFKISLKNAWE
ncbi:MAG: hypothetical protein CVV57_00920 [Tenericutes bacterium HGW-Tenericutes-2]|jgi:hypothetical protein|nr:MAG: hypothetical protein CVV57_00920 [Tenericutes bacterium HGW-Tenericutes-2]